MTPSNFFVPSIFHSHCRYQKQKEKRKNPAEICIMYFTFLILLVFSILAKNNSLSLHAFPEFASPSNLLPSSPLDKIPRIPQPILQQKFRKPFSKNYQNGSFSWEVALSDLFFLPALIRHGWLERLTIEIGDRPDRVVAASIPIHHTRKVSPSFFASFVATRKSLGR